MDLREQTKQLFEQGERLIDIADKLEINYNTVKQWRNRGKWKKPKKVTRKVTSKSDSRKPMKPEISFREENGGLTEKQRLFVELYVRNFNATQAAIKAGYAPSGAFVEGCRLLKKPKVREYLEELKALRKETLLFGEDDIVDRYMRIAFADMTDFTEFGVEEIPIITKLGLPVMITNPDTGIEEPLTHAINVVKFKSSNQVDGGLICEIKTSRQGASIKLENRQKALDWLSDYFEMNPEHKYKKEHDEKKLQIERERLQHTKEIDGKKYW